MNENSTIILIPHYNDFKGVETSLRSIKEEINVDVLIVDDGSKIRLDLRDLKTFYNNDGKISLINLEKNQGIEYALNEGLREIIKQKYKIIARLDCGDRCFPNRFKKQLDYLKDNPKVKLLGTQVKFVDGDYNYLYTSNFPISDKRIKKYFYLNSMIAHPTAIFYTEILKEVGFYPTNYPAAEDYALFFEIVKRYEVHNLKQIYLEKVIDDKSISTLKRKLQVKNRMRIVLKHFYIGFYPIYGLTRGMVLYLFPTRITTFVKKTLKH